MANKRTPLFRPSAIGSAVARAPRYEDVRLPRDLRRYASLVVVLVCLGVWLLAQARYAEKFVVAGRLTDGTTELYSSSAGTVSKLHVAVGDRVRTGDLLMTIKTLRSTGRDQRSRLALGQLLVEERRELAALIAIAFEQRRAAVVSNARRRQELAREQQLLRRQRALLLGEADRQRSQVRRMQSLLQRGLIARIDIEQATGLQHRAETAALDNAIKLAAADSQQASLEEKRLADVSAFDEKVAGLTLELLATDRRLHEFQSAQEQYVTADFDGVVAQRLVSVNQTVGADTPLVSIRPDGRPLMAELYLYSNALEIAKVGTSIRLRYDAYPYRKYGLFEGTIVELGETGVPVSSDAAPVFRARASLHAPAGHEKHALELRDDMTLVADLRGEPRRVIHWLLSPMLGVWQRSAT